MKLIEDKIHQLHEEARNEQNKQMDKGESLDIIPFLNV